MRSRVVKKVSSGWAGVDPEGYVPGEATAVVRHTIVGGRKCSAGEEGPALELRYFELPPGAVTRLEKHEHEHYVIIGHGRGHAIVGTEVHEVGPHDVVYVGRLEAHQFVNRGAEPFGFFCIVSAVRDVSQELSPEEVERLLASPAGTIADPFGAPRARAEADRSVPRGETRRI
jgi:mannose-6-phosphate isomerase-like protein (cupin superfamily)